MPSTRLAIIFLLALPLVGQTTTKKKPKTPVVIQANESIADLRAKAEKGDANAQVNLGVRFLKGEGVPQDHAEAVKWFHKAAEQGNVGAQHNLGVIYFQGEEYIKGMNWYLKAANKGFVASQLNLAMCYHKGEVVPQDHAEAVKWFRIAAEQGNAEAQYALGRAYCLGEGVPQDYTEAYVWLSLSAANGNANASKIRDIAAEKLTPPTLERAQARAGKLYKEIQARIGKR
jgi:uncharacterized protein